MLTVTENNTTVIDDYRIVTDVERIELDLHVSRIPAVIPTKLGNQHPFIYQRIDCSCCYYWQHGGFIELILKLQN